MGCKSPVRCPAHDKIPPMQQSLEKLRKFFRLEHGNGYNNTAIIGGLARMLDYWEGEARADSLTEEVIQAVVQRLRSYESLSPSSRADALKGLWKRIGETYPEVGQKQQSQTPTTPRPAPQSAPKPAPDKPADSQPQPAPRPRPAAPARSDVVPGAKTSATPAALNAALTVLQGVGPRHAETLKQLGLHTLEIGRAHV